MRLTVLRSNLTRMIPVLLAALLLLVLATFSSTPSVKKTPSDQKVFGSKIQSEQQELKVSPSQPGIINEDVSSGQQTSSSTKVHVSVNSNTTNGETNGSSNVEITTNGQTQNFSDALDDCIADGDIRVRVDGTKISCESDNGNLEIKWRSNNDQDTENESSFKQDVDIDKDYR